MSTKLKITVKAQERYLFRNLHYIDRDGHEEFHMRSQRPEHLKKKVTLLNYYSDYMSDHLLKVKTKINNHYTLEEHKRYMTPPISSVQTGAAMGPKEGDEIARLPHLRSWFRTHNAIVLHLSLGILQVSAHTRITRHAFSSFPLPRLISFETTPRLLSVLAWAP